MSTIFYFIKGCSNNLVQKFRHLEEVVYVYQITGDFDVVIKAEVATVHKIGQLTDKLSRMDGVDCLSYHLVLS